MPIKTDLFQFHFLPFISTCYTICDTTGYSPHFFAAATPSGLFTHLPLRNILGKCPTSSLRENSRHRHRAKSAASTQEGQITQTQTKTGDCHTERKARHAKAKKGIKPVITTMRDRPRLSCCPPENWSVPNCRYVEKYSKGMAVRVKRKKVTR